MASKQPLVVYYSLTGNTALVARALHTELGGELVALEPVKDLDPDSKMRFFWGGAQARMHKKPKLKPYAVDLAACDVLFLGSPVWAWTFTPPLRAFLAEVGDLTEHPVALWMCAAGSGSKALKKFGKRVEKLGARVVDTLVLKEPLENDPETQEERARAWGKAVVEAL